VSLSIVSDISVIASFDSLDDFFAADTSRLIADNSKKPASIDKIIFFIINYPNKNISIIAITLTIPNVPKNHVQKSFRSVGRLPTNFPD